MQLSGGMKWRGIALRSGIVVWLSSFEIGGRFCGFLHLHLDAQPIETVSGFALHIETRTQTYTIRTHTATSATSGMELPFFFFFFFFMKFAWSALIFF